MATAPLTEAERKALRIEQAANRSKAHHALTIALDHYGACDRFHARTNRSADWLDLLIAEDELLTAVEAVTGWCLDDIREQVRDAAREEGYSIEEGCYYSDDGDLIPEGRFPTNIGYADYATDMRRESVA